jgi:hypothetical protein
LYLDLGLSHEDEQRSLLNEKHLELDNSLNQAVLLCPRDMDPLGLVVSECLNRIVVTAGAHPKMPEEEWKHLTTIEAGAVVGRFLAAARNDLATPSLSDRWSERSSAVTAHVISWGQDLKRRLGLTVSK